MSKSMSPFPAPDLIFNRKEYWKGATVIEHARQYGDYKELYIHHLPEPDACIDRTSYYAGHQMVTICDKAKLLGELTKGLPKLPDSLHEASVARYGRWCYDQAVTDEAEKRKTVIDLNEVSMKGLHDVYVAKFGPLPEQIMMNDILWHIHQLIKEAPIKEE